MESLTIGDYHTAFKEEYPYRRYSLNRPLWIRDLVFINHKCGHKRRFFDHTVKVKINNKWYVITNPYGLSKEENAELVKITEELGLNYFIWSFSPYNSDTLMIVFWKDSE